MIKEARSGIHPENLDEILNAAASVKQALQTGQNQYQTPTRLAALLNSLLPMQPYNIFDPQCAGGNTLRNGILYASKYGFEIDKRFKDVDDGVFRVIGNCVKVWDVLDDVFPDWQFECQVANPPFGLRWELPNGSKVDSTEYTWRKMMERCAPVGYGWFMASSKTLERLGIHNHERVYLYQKFPAGVWDNTTVEIGVVHYHASSQRPEKKTLVYSLQGTPEKPLFPDLEEHRQELDLLIEAYSEMTLQRFGGADSPWIILAQVQSILNEEAGKQPEHNIWLNKDGRLGIYLSTRTKTKRKLSGDEIQRLCKVKDCHPLSLTVDRETRKLLAELSTNGFYTMQPAARRAIEDALKQVETLAVPLMPVTEFQHVAYADEEDVLECHTDFRSPHGQVLFQAGRKYGLTTAAYNFTNHFKRKKLEYREEGNESYTTDHNCSLSGMGRYLQVADNHGDIHRFMEHPNPDVEGEHDDAILWTIFKKPEVRTVAETCAELVERNVLTLETCEMMADYRYYPGQKSYLARVATKDYGLIGAATGAGKSLFALSLIQIKAPERALIVAPQGTTRGSKEEPDDGTMEDEFQASQWIQELRRFAPGMAVFELFSMADYHRIKNANRGELPPGVYITYYEALFQNGARECCPDSWDNPRVVRETELLIGEPVKLPAVPDGADPNYWAKSIGREVHGIRCVLAPSMATQIGHLFDFVALDEAHKITNLNANVTQMAIRLQPRYRYALSATPIPNVISNLFSIMGWLCVQDWYKGGRLNAAWPYARHEIERFNSAFLSEERDYTEEENRRKANKDWRGKCVKTSPIISSPARLLKLLSPTMAYISKSQCNPLVKQPVVREIRVPLGSEQSRLYGHFMNRGNIKFKNPLVRARVQGSYLRAICADPAGFEHGGPKVASNFNPKTMAMLELAYELLAKGQPLVIVSARVGQTDTYESKLSECGIECSRIDSTIPADQHSWQANRFKRGDTRIHLMGVKCAMAYSFSECPNLAIGSIEYSPGVLEQAKGRIDRVNSKFQPNIWCILHKATIEETMYDIVATKQDAATICLHGQRIARDFKPVDASEVMALAFLNWEQNGKNALLETDCEAKWPSLRDAFKKL